ncbi:MAG TPA: hypothetical protein PKM26_00240 [Syntrophorhabdaceae bacterium]|nr:hypothetical protein [Syntrophorhabdaceae bacterium]
MCLSCGRQFQNSPRRERPDRIIWKEYVYHRQTIDQLSGKHDRGKDWIRERIR